MQIVIIRQGTQEAIIQQDHHRQEIIHQEIVHQEIVLDIQQEITILDNQHLLGVQILQDLIEVILEVVVGLQTEAIVLDHLVVGVRHQPVAVGVHLLEAVEGHTEGVKLYLLLSGTNNIKPKLT